MMRLVSMPVVLSRFSQLRIEALSPTNWSYGILLELPVSLGLAQACLEWEDAVRSGRTLIKALQSPLATPQPPADFVSTQDLALICTCTSSSNGWESEDWGMPFCY